MDNDLRLIIRHTDRLNELAILPQTEAVVANMVIANDRLGLLLAAARHRMERLRRTGMSV